MRRGIVVVAVGLTLVAAACADSSDSSDAGDETTTNRIVEPGDVAAHPDGTQVVTQGVLVIADDTRLCDVILESAPPQCGGNSVVLGDLQRDDVVALQAPTDPEGQGVAWTTYPLPVTGTVQGGILVNTEIAGRIHTEEGNGLRVRLMSVQKPLFPRQLRSGEPIWWAIDVTNITDEPIPLTFGSSQVADVSISDGDTELYRWSNEKAFTQEIHDIQFAAGVTSGATLTDAFVTDPGTNYTLRGWVTAIGANDVVVTVPVEVIAPSVGASPDGPSPAP